MARDARRSDDKPINDAPNGADAEHAARTQDAQEKPRRGPKAKPAIEPSDIQGLKYFDKLKPSLARLHEVGAERDTANNRDLHMDQYCLLVLMWMFSPILTSMQALQQASELDKVQKKLGVGRASLGSLSESVSVFDPEPLKQIAAELADQIPQPGQGRFDSIGKTMTAVDGSVVDTIVRVARLAKNTKRWQEPKISPHRSQSISTTTCPPRSQPLSILLSQTLADQLQDWHS